MAGQKNRLWAHEPDPRVTPLTSAFRGLRRLLGGTLLVAFAQLAPVAPVASVAQAAPGAARGSDDAREHTVGHGQTLARIAARYGLTVSTLAAANGMRRGDGLRLGQLLLIPPRGVVYVGTGETLGGIARRNGTTALELAKVNRLPPEASLRVGQQLLLPGYEPAARQHSAERRWGRPQRPGRVTLFREAMHEKRTLQLVDRRGRVPDASLNTVKRLLRPRGARTGKLPHPRLLRLLARVSDHFGGRPVHAISGFRKAGGATRETSRHVAGQAIDFRIPGVPLDELRKFCAQLDHVGVGYYPNSRFVHLDVRRTDARWTDLAGPGEAARLLRRPAQPGAAEAEDVGDEPVADDDGQDPVDDDSEQGAAMAPIAPGG